MDSSSGEYHPPTVVFDDNEKTAVAEPLLGEHRSGQKPLVHSDALRIKHAVSFA